MNNNPDAWAMLIQAEDFYDAYSILDLHNDCVARKELNQPHRESDPKCPKIIHTADIVCLAFSLELFLKCVHKITGGAIPRGHNLHALFNALPNNVQHELKSNMHIPDDPFRLDPFNITLLEMGNAFTQWRYAHENRQMKFNIGFAIELIKAIKKYIEFHKKG